ncbi:MAG: hypothetical protein AAF624_09515 [Bacteroidota bacterium]
MGQQQLLLLVLGIVGLAAVNGVQPFSENSVKAAQDQAAAHASRTLGQILAWKQTPAALGGGRERTLFDGFTFDQIGKPAASRLRNDREGHGGATYRETGTLPSVPAGCEGW